MASCVYLFVTLVVEKIAQRELLYTYGALRVMDSWVGDISGYKQNQWKIYKFLYIGMSVHTNHATSATGM